MERRAFLIQSGAVLGAIAAPTSISAANKSGQTNSDCEDAYTAPTLPESSEAIEDWEHQEDFCGSTYSWAWSGNKYENTSLRDTIEEEFGQSEDLWSIYGWSLNRIRSETEESQSPTEAGAELCPNAIDGLCVDVRTSLDGLFGDSTPEAVSQAQTLFLDRLEREYSISDPSDTDTLDTDDHPWTDWVINFHRDSISYSHSNAEVFDTRTYFGETSGDFVPDESVDIPLRGFLVVESSDNERSYTVVGGVMPNIDEIDTTGFLSDDGYRMEFSPSEYPKQTREMMKELAESVV